MIKNKILMVMIALVCAVCIVPGVMALSGAGTSTDPYIITTTTEWIQMDQVIYNYDDVYYALGNDLDFHSDSTESYIIQMFGSHLDGRGYAIKNFYQPNAELVVYNGITPGIGMFSVVSSGTEADGYIKNLRIINSTIIVDESFAFSGILGKNIGLIIGTCTDSRELLENIYVDENSWLYVNSAIPTNKGDFFIGGISAGEFKMKNIVWRGNLYIATPLKNPWTEVNVYGDHVGGISGSNAHDFWEQIYQPENILSAGHIYFTQGTGTAFSSFFPGEYYQDGEIYNPTNVVQSIYYDTTTLSNAQPTGSTYGVPTSGIKTQTNFPNMTFGVGYLMMTSIHSPFYYGYPAPYGLRGVPTDLTPSDDYVPLFPCANTLICVNATSYWTNDPGFEPYQATNPFNLYIDPLYFNPITYWNSAGGINTNEWFSADLGSGAILKQLAVINYASGNAVQFGADHFQLYGTNSTTSFEDLDYADTSGWTLISTNVSEFYVHPVDGLTHTQYVLVTNTAPYRYYGLRIADNYGGDTINIQYIEYEGDFSAVPPPTPTPTPTPTPVPTVTVTTTLTPAPTPIVYPSSPSKVWWATPNSTAHITTAHFGDTVRYNFDTVVNEVNPAVAYRLDYFYLNLWKQNTQTGVWTYVSHPAFNAQINGSTISTYEPPNTGLLFSGDAWSGWYDISTSDNNKIEVVGANFSVSTYPPFTYGSAIITRHQNPLLVSNLGTWAQSVGGDGLRFFLALVIMLLLICLPYLLLKQFNIYIETIMFALAIGISFYAGLLDLWVLFAVGIGLIAIYLLLNRSGGQNNG